MSNIYNDYSGNTGDKKDVTFEEDHQPEEQFNGKSLFSNCTYFSCASVSYAT